MPDTDPSTAAPWAESGRRSLQRRERARRTRRNRWSLRACAGVALASLTIASAGALAATSTVTSTKASAAKAKKPTTKQVQRALGIKADGVMGPQTRRAIKRFQKRHGLKADGVVGPATIKALGLSGAGSSRSTSTSTSTSTSDTRTLEQAPEDAPTALAKIAQCESGGDPTAISADGRYHGKYQFSRGTWEAYGGTGDPADADEATQDAIAAKLYAAEGTKPWPVCAADL